MQNWFNYQASNRNTVKAWACTYGIGKAIAKHIQALILSGGNQGQVEQVVKASKELVEQVGH